jgi:hypothetical protein
VLSVCSSSVLSVCSSSVLSDCADGRETRTVRHCLTFSTCLPTSCGSLPPPLPPVQQAPSPDSRCRAWPFDLHDDVSVVVSKRLGAL